MLKEKIGNFFPEGFVSLFSRKRHFGSPKNWWKVVPVVRFSVICNIVKPPNSGHLRVLKNLSAIETCPLLGGRLTKIVTFETKHFGRYSTHVRYLECPPLGGFTVPNIWEDLRLPNSESGTFFPGKICDLENRALLFFPTISTNNLEF